MIPLEPDKYKKLALAVLWLWFGLSLYPAYGKYVDSLSKIKNFNQENINVFFVSTVLEKLKPKKEKAVLIILPPGLLADERWFYHFRIRYRLYPQKIDFAEILGRGMLKKVSYDYRNYKKPLPLSLDASNLLPLKTKDYTYIITLAGARAHLPGFSIITDARDVRAIVYKRRSP